MRKEKSGAHPAATDRGREVGILCVPLLLPDPLSPFRSLCFYQWLKGLLSLVIGGYWFQLSIQVLCLGLYEATKQAGSSLHFQTKFIRVEGDWKRG